MVHFKDDMDNRRTGARWGDRPPRAAVASEDGDALQALLGDANSREEKKRAADLDRRNQPSNRARRPNDAGDGGYNKRSRPRKAEIQEGESAGYYGRAPGDAMTTAKRVVEEDEEPSERKKRRWNDEGNRDGEEEPEPPAENPNKQKADFGLSGALANDAKTGNVFNGVTLKFQEPAEARVPNTVSPPMYY